MDNMVKNCFAYFQLHLFFFRHVRLLNMLTINTLKTKQP